MKRIALLITFTCLLTGCGDRDRPDRDAISAPDSAPIANVKKRKMLAQDGQVQPSPAYEELLKSADELIQKRDWKGAIRVLGQSINAEPQRVEAYIKRAAILAEAKLLPSAVADMSAAIKIHPDDAKLLNTRGYFLLLTQQYDRAEQDFNDAVGFNLNYPQPYNNRGLVWIARGKQLKAQKDLRFSDEFIQTAIQEMEGSKKDPENADDGLRDAVLSFKTIVNDYENAVKDFDNAIRIKSDYLDALNNRGFALIQLNRLDEAIASLSQALNFDPRYVNALANRGRAYMLSHRYQEAVADFTQAIAIQPEQLQYYDLRSQAHQANGQVQDAAQDAGHVDWAQRLNELNQQIAHTPNNADLWAAQGRQWLLEDRFDEAAQSFSKALSLKADHSPALIGRAFVHFHHERFADAIADCSRALQETPNYEASVLRGDAYFETQHYQAAVADYEAARRFDLRAVAAYRKCAEQLRANGEPAQAQANEAAADTMEKQLTGSAVRQTGAPRAFVIEQTSYETQSAAEPETRQQ